MSAAAAIDWFSLTERFGTPLYVYDLDTIAARAAALQAVLPRGYELAYALKANPALAIVAHLGSLGWGADVASAGELTTALRAGIDPGQVVFTGPGKRDAELLLAARAGLRAVTVESAGELDRLEAIASGSGRRVPILIRLAAGGVGADGLGSFGMDEADVVAAARRAVRSPALELIGLHAFGASNVLDAVALARHAERTLLAARRVARAVGWSPSLLDIGGGLGIPYADGEPELDLVALGASLPDPGAGLTVLIEPGRYPVGPAGMYLASVLEVKRVGGRTVAVLDGGIHHLARPALLRQAHRLRVHRRSPDVPLPTAARTVSLAGPLCTGLDTFGELLEAAPVPGDLIEVRDAGAYGFTESMPLFLSHPTPPEVALRDGLASLIRPSLAPSTWLDGQRLHDPALAGIASSPALARSPERGTIGPWPNR